jgi:hypothetical protein
MPPALASHDTRVARDDRTPELLVVGHAKIVERAGSSQSMTAALTALIETRR